LLFILLYLVYICSPNARLLPPKKKILLQHVCFLLAALQGASASIKGVIKWSFSVGYLNDTVYHSLNKLQIYMDVR